MTDKEIIEKATKALKALDLLADYNSIGVYRDINPIILEMNPDIEFQYSVHFNFNPPVLGTGAAITVDKKTNKLLKIITKNGLYKVPEELQ